jgi:hypothetical protein
MMEARISRKMREDLVAWRAIFRTAAILAAAGESATS